MSLQELISNADYIIKSVEDSKSRLDIVSKCIEDDNLAIAALQNKQKIIIRAREFYKKVIDNLYTTKMLELQELCNSVVSSIFYDEDYSVKMDLSDKYGKSVSWYLRDNVKDVETSLKRGNGKGLKTVISTIIYVYYLLKFKVNYLFADELFSNISEAYVPKFLEFIKYLCKSKNLCLVLISHDERLIEHADKVYYLNDGVVRNVSKS